MILWKHSFTNTIEKNNIDFNIYVTITTSTFLQETPKISVYFQTKYCFQFPSKSIKYT